MPYIRDKGKFLNRKVIQGIQTYNINFNKISIEVIRTIFSGSFLLKIYLKFFFNSGQEQRKCIKYTAENLVKKAGIPLVIWG